MSSRKKILSRAVVNETPTNYIPVERLKKCRIRDNYVLFNFDFCFPKATEAVNSKMTGRRSSELIGYVDLVIFRGEIW